MPMENNRHVVPNADGGWDVKAPGAKRSSSHHDTQRDAEQRAKEIVRNAGGGEVRIHDRKGRGNNRPLVEEQPFRAGLFQQELGPLFATVNSTAPPESAPLPGKVVSFEELAQLVRRRRTRSKRIPKGQLSLFRTDV